LNRLLATCHARADDDAAPEVECQSINDQQYIIGDAGSNSLLLMMVEEYTRGEVGGSDEIEVQFAGVLGATDPDDCPTLVEIINAAFASYLDGTFAGCEMTTPTTSPVRICAHDGVRVLHACVRVRVIMLYAACCIALGTEGFLVSLFRSAHVGTCWG
jgi:hypothetical protein